MCSFLEVLLLSRLWEGAEETMGAVFSLTTSNKDSFSLRTNVANKQEEEVNEEECTDKPNEGGGAPGIHPKFLAVKGFYSPSPPLLFFHNSRDSSEEHNIPSTKFSAFGKRAQ